MKTTLSNAAVKERKAYYKAWREENKDKVKKYTASYWERKAGKSNG